MGSRVTLWSVAAVLSSALTEQLLRSCMCTPTKAIRHAELRTGQCIINSILCRQERLQLYLKQHWDGELPVVSWVLMNVTSALLSSSMSCNSAYML